MDVLKPIMMRSCEQLVNSMIQEGVELSAVQIETGKTNLFRLNHVHQESGLRVENHLYY